MNPPKPSYMKSWLLFFLVASVGGALAGGFLGALIGGVLGADGVSMGHVQLITGTVGFLVAVPISFFTFRWSVGNYIVEPLLRPRSQPPAL